MIGKASTSVMQWRRTGGVMDGGTIFCLSLLNQGKEAGGRPSFSSIFGEVNW